MNLSVDADNGSEYGPESGEGSPNSGRATLRAPLHAPLHTPLHTPQDSPEQPEVTIALRDVRKRYGTLSVLSNLQLSVQAGEVFGFLGRNGAGKSTAIRIIMGITRADAGTVEVFGRALDDEVIEVRRRIGYVAQEQNLYPWMTPRVLARFVSGFYPRWDTARWLQLNKDFGLPPKRRIGTFSGGMKARLALSVALSSRPDLLVLDEPTAGMDPVARREFIDLVREHTARDGATTFFSTHLVDEIEAVADRIGIIEGGRTLYEGRLAPLRDSLARYSVAVEDDVPDSLPGSFAREQAHVLENVERRGRRILTLQFEHVAPSDAAAPLSPGWRREPMTLEDMFIATVATGRGATQRDVADTSATGDGMPDRS